MPIPALKVLLDTEQPRVRQSRIGVTVAGDQWDGPNYSETWLVPKVNTLACNPAPLRSEWHTAAATGINARWGLSDFNLIAADGWRMAAVKDGPGAVRMQNKRGMASSAILSASVLANRAIFVSYFAFNVGNDDSAVYFDCGWTSTGDYHYGVALRFWSGGKCDVYKEGAYLATYTLGNARGSQTANRYVDLLIVPMRGRELLVYSVTSGDSFVHVFADIPEDAEDPEVTPNEPFWWHVPTFDPAKPATVDVEIAPVSWVGGYATSVELGLGRAPCAACGLESWENAAPFASVANGRLFASAFPQGGDVAGIALVELDGSTAFVPNGSRKDCRMRIEMTGGAHTAFVDGAHMAFEAEVVQTSAPEDGPFDLSPYIREAELTKCDGADPAELSLTLGWPMELDGLVHKLFTVSNRPAQGLVGDVVWIDGVTMPLKFVDGEHDGVMLGKLTIRDRMHSLREAAMRERMPMDGMPLCKPAGMGGAYGSAVEFWYRQIGLREEDLDLDDADHDIPRVPAVDAKDFCHLADIGARPYTELEELQQDFAATFVWGIVPTAGGPKAVFKDPDGLSSTPDYTLYRSDEDAEAAGADDRDAG